MISHYLKVEFAPLTDPETTGTIPDHLNGRYLRNEPNPIGEINAARRSENLDARGTDDQLPVLRAFLAVRYPKGLGDNAMDHGTARPHARTALRRLAAIALACVTAGIIATGCSNAPSLADNTASGAGGVPTRWFAVRSGDSSKYFRVQGAILQKYLATGDASSSSMGLPISNEQPGPGGGRYSRFEAGAIYWTPQTGAHIVSGPIRMAWEYDYGGASGQLGYPTTDQQAIPGGLRQHFQHGTITATDGQPTIQGPELPKLSSPK